MHVIILQAKDHIVWHVISVLVLVPKLPKLPTHFQCYNKTVHS